MRKIFIYIFTVSLLVGFLGCKRDVLNIKPTTQFSDEVVWNDVALATTFINHIYRTIPHDFTYGPLKLPSTTDELFRRGGSADFITSGNINPSSIGILDYWTGVSWPSYWTTISQCNIFLDKMATSTLEESQKNPLIAQAQFIRAFSYFGLTSLFGGVPIITKPFKLDDNLNVKRNSYEDCMTFIISELDLAAQNLPLNWGASDEGRITKGAALAIKARALLYWASPLNNPGSDQNKWQAAADAAKAVIDLGQYSLYPDYGELFLHSELYNSEAIWTRPFNMKADPEASYIELSLFPNGYNGFGQLHPLQNLVDDYEMKNGEMPILGYDGNGNPIINPKSGYDPQNPYVNRDPRFYYSILYDGAPFQGRQVEVFLPGGKDSNEGSLSPWNATLTGYYPRKFTDESIINPSGNNHGSEPYIFIRYAEILLDYAEAMYHLGQEDVCREYLNKVRSRPGVEMPPVTASGEDLLSALQHEDRIEFAFEDNRYFDVRRWKIAPEVLNLPARKMSVYRDPNTGKKTYTVSIFQERHFSDKNYLVPIPQSEIDKNGELTQNPGY